MKSILKYLLVTSLFGIMLSGCNYLDIVPDEKETAEDAFEDLNAAKRYLYSCYSYLPKPSNATGALDLLTGDEVVTAFEHETFASFPKGNYTASTPVISYWNTLFQGLRQCYMLQNNLEHVPGMSDSQRADYAAQVKFLIAYYHLLLVRCYGPVILIKEEPSINTPASDYLGRTPLDECVEWICNLFDEAAAVLPVERTQIQDYGLATSTAAKSLKAYLLLYAASPLFNGNSEFYSDLKNPDGTLLMPLTYDADKWVKAKEAYKEAIELCEKNGYKLYETTDLNEGNSEPSDPTQHCLRYVIMDKGNKEIVWADCRSFGYYGIQNKSLPYVSAAAWNGIAPTLAMVKRFYTENGLPIDVDPATKSDNLFQIVTVDAEHAGQAEEGNKTLRINLDREPRYYAWVAFQGGYYEVLSASSNGAYDKDASYQKYSGNGAGKLVCDFVLNGNCARGTYDAATHSTNLRTNNYSPSGFLNKKAVNPGFSVSTSLQGCLDHPWPIVRMAELYLGYAEACVECNDLATAKIYLNKVRKRAGIPTVEESWEHIAGIQLTQDRLRDIVRQERMIEFYLENQNFWDMRRWLLAKQYFGVKAQGMNIEATTLEEFAQPTEVIFERKFTSPANYLMPIPLSDIQKNDKLVQNPGY